MPTTLNSRSKAALLGLSGLVSLLALMLVRPIPVLPVTIGALFGAVVGVLQSRSIPLATRRLWEAKSSGDVHRALISTIPGRRALAIHWIGFVVVLAVAVWPARDIRDVLWHLFAGYSALDCGHESFSLGAVVRHNRGGQAAGQ